VNGVPVAHRLDWQTLVNRLFDRRCLSKEPKLYTLTIGAEEVLFQWSNGFTAKLEALPVELARHLVWLPQLTRRLALLMEVMGNPGGETISEAAARAAIGVTKALGRAHIGTLLEIIVPAKNGLTDATDRTDKSAEMLSMVLKKGPISRRELRRSFDDQRIGWFDETLQGLMSLGKVRRGEDGLLVASDSGSNSGGSDHEQDGDGETERRGDETR
jgi:hypothetical protein